jgi:hypothetical protein
MAETHIHWTGIPDETVEAFDQILRIRISTNPEDPLGTLLISADGFNESSLPLPNSISTEPAWTAVPGTSPILEIRQDWHYPQDYIRVRTT